MKISVICMGRGSVVKAVNGQEMVIHHVDFAVKREKEPQRQSCFGALHFESTEHFHYKEKREYTLILSESISIVSGLDLKKAGNLN